MGFPAGTFPGDFLVMGAEIEAVDLFTVRSQKLLDPGVAGVNRTCFVHPQRDPPLVGDDDGKVTCLAEGMKSFGKARFQFDFFRFMTVADIVIDHPVPI